MRKDMTKILIKVKGESKLLFLEKASQLISE